MTVHTRIRAMMVATNAFVTCMSLFTTATLLTQPSHHGVLGSSLTFRMSKTMIVRLDRPRGTRRSSKKKSSSREQQSSLRGFLILTELSSVTSYGFLHPITRRLQRPSARAPLPPTFIRKLNYVGCMISTDVYDFN